MTQVLASQKPNTPASYKRHVATVVLNYNSHADLLVSVPQLAEQRGVEHTLIIVDNASRAESVAQVSEWLAGWRPDAVTGTQAEVDAWVKSHPQEARQHGRVYFVMHPENRGYSVGNNIGIRLADALGADAVLIANPDMRIEDPHYLAELTKELFGDEQNYVAASRIVGLDGKDQSPLREPTFWEELLWPRFYLSQFLKPISYILPVSGEEPVRVPKVSGCCLLLRLSYLKATGHLDEGVFLYCEEPILAARVRSASGHIIFVPSLSAVHAHARSEKGNSSRRMLLFIKSRRYYLERYSGYDALQRYFLGMSYLVLHALHRLKICLERQS